MRVVLDVDPGVDDALAILLALASPEIDLIGVTTVAGNVTLEQATRNALALLEVGGASHVPVHVGASRPLVGRVTTATLFHGADGLGDVGVAAPRGAAKAASAAEFLCSAARGGGEPMTVIALGPLTNLALACMLDASWPARVDRVVAMCGTIQVAGNVTPVAEANCYADPEALALLLGSGLRITMVPLDATRLAALTSANLREYCGDIEADLGSARGVAIALLKYYVAMAARLGFTTADFHDPVAVAAAIQPSLVGTRRLRVDVELTGALTRGQTVAVRSGRREVVVNRGDHDDVIGLADVVGNVDVVLEVDANAFAEVFLGRVLRAGA
jgi:inosine-uridine nucleoside N-ribohydrolase